MRSRIVLATAVFALLAAAVVSAASLGSRTGRGMATGSSFRADETGLLAARRLLEGLGYDVVSRRGAVLPRGRGHVLIRIEGLPRPASETESEVEEERRAGGQRLSEWVAQGNAAIVLASRAVEGTDFPAVGGDGLPVADVAGDFVWDTTPQVVPGDGLDEVEEAIPDGLSDPWIAGAWHVVTGHGDEVLARAPGSSGDGDPLVVDTRRGDGRVVVIADPYFASNAKLAKSDNAAWLAVLVARVHGGGQVLFDDRAVGQAATRGVLSLLGEKGLWPAIAAGALLLLLVWWRVGPSDAPDRHVREDASYRPESFVLVRADLYAECLTPQDARRMVRDEVARRLGRGDALGCDRALAMLAARDPARAERIRRALDALPDDARVTPRRHADTWCAAVADVWRAIGPAPGAAAAAPAPPAQPASGPTGGPRP